MFRITLSAIALASCASGLPPDRMLARVEANSTLLLDFARDALACEGAPRMPMGPGELYYTDADAAQAAGIAPVVCSPLGPKVQAVLRTKGRIKATAVPVPARSPGYPGGTGYDVVRSKRVSGIRRRDRSCGEGAANVNAELSGADAVILFAQSRYSCFGASYAYSVVYTASEEAAAACRSSDARVAQVTPDLFLRTDEAFTVCTP